MAIDILLISELIILPLLTLAAYRFIIQRLHGSKPTRPLPPGPRGWPVLGALPLLGRQPHITLAEMAKRYGPIMYLKMGMQGVAIASSPNAARAFIKTHDLQFASRPMIGTAKHVTYEGEQALVFAQYGPRWKLLRKLLNLHMFGATALNEWADYRSTEVDHMLRSMLESSRRGEPVAIRGMLVCALANLLGQTVLSRRVFESEGPEFNEFKEMMEELLLTSVSNIGDFIPAVAWMDLQGFESRLKRLQKRFDGFLTRLVNEHAVGKHERKGKPDFLDLLQTHPQDSDGVSLSDTSIKGLLLDLFAAGTDTTSSTLERAMSELLTNPSMLERAQAEMDQVVGKNRRLQESDLPKLPYLQAICKEALRMHPSPPINVPRISSEACEVDGYHIPKNTWLLFNIWVIGRDPNVWEKPTEFDPERFLSGREGANVDPIGGGDLEFMPFGAGRRMCAGARLATMFLEYALGSFVHSFDWKVPGGVDFDLDEAFGLALWKKEPFSAMVTPRLPLSLYV